MELEKKYKGLIIGLFVVWHSVISWCFTSVYYKAKWWESTV